jgi:hypothetical protein
MLTMRRTAVASNIDNDPFLSSLSMPALDPSILTLPPTRSGRSDGLDGDAAAPDTEALTDEALDAFELPDYNYLME